MFEIVLSRGYGENNFREDLKTLYLKLGIENKSMIFLFTDAHVAEEGFLELINNMLTSGDMSLLIAKPECTCDAQLKARHCSSLISPSDNHSYSVLTLPNHIVSPDAETYALLEDSILPEIVFQHLLMVAYLCLGRVSEPENNKPRAWCLIPNY